MKKILSIVMFVLLLTFVQAQDIIQEGHLKLLAVREIGGGFQGSTADLYLEIRPGSGRVFLDTFPLTKTDTQISTRFAKEVACSFLNKDCSSFDFVYTIKADSSIIAGPSAGAATAALTVLLLGGIPVNESVAITGTINSGGLVGHVGGVKEKIDAGAAAGLKKILIPQGEQLIDSRNRTINIVEIENEKGIEIREVATLNEVLYELTGKKLKPEGKELVVDENYTTIMGSLALDLCNRSEKLQGMIEGVNQSLLEEPYNLTERGSAAFETGSYYSAASYCFGANVKLSELYMMSRNFSDLKIRESIEQVRNNIGNIQKRIDAKAVRTITDIEAYASVKERLLDADKYLTLALGNLNDSHRAIADLAYASERVYSAVSWYKFFQHIGKELDLSNTALKESCQEKIGEAEERFQYVEILLPSFLQNTQEEINYAYSYLNSEDYELCLFKASLAKAQADIVLNLVGLNLNESKEQLDIKLGVVKESIIRETELGIFPVIAYSYYEYANSLKETDLSSALLYSEYALELSNLDLYFYQPQEKVIFAANPDLGIFIIGIAAGLILSLFIRKRS
ncbi:MAG TPA: S16 family serine protease [Candidatus Nanoarchaeia archaeon]|nr:S16 family serine protease [Candidatus Nanoarchaeia archaeon]